MNRLNRIDKLNNLAFFNLGIEAMNRLFQSPAAESVEAYKRSSTEYECKFRSLSVLSSNSSSDKN